MEGSLLLAAKLNDVKMAQCFISETEKTNENDETALMVAVQNKFCDVARLVVQLQQKRANGAGATALMLASLADNAEMIQIIAPFEANLKDPQNQTALMHAVRENKLRSVKALAEVEAESVKAMEELNLFEGKDLI